MPHAACSWVSKLSQHVQNVLFAKDLYQVGFATKPHHIKEVDGENHL